MVVISVGLLLRSFLGLQTYGRIGGRLESEKEPGSGDSSWGSLESLCMCVMRSSMAGLDLWPASGGIRSQMTAET